MPLIYLKSKGPHESVSKARLAETWAFIDAFIKRVDSSLVSVVWVVEFLPDLRVSIVKIL